MCNFLRNFPCVFQNATLYVLTSSSWEFRFYNIFINNTYDFLNFYFMYCCRYVMIPHFSFNYHFPTNHRWCSFSQALIFSFKYLLWRSFYLNLCSFYFFFSKIGCFLIIDMSSLYSDYKLFVRSKALKSFLQSVRKHILVYIHTGICTRMFMCVYGYRV